MTDNKNLLTVNSEHLPYIVGITRQPDRLNLISHLIVSLNKLTQPKQTVFFDILYESLPLSTDKIRPLQHSLREPLDPNHTLTPLEQVEGTSEAIREKHRPFFRLTTKQGDERFIFPIFRSTQPLHKEQSGKHKTVASILIQDFPQGKTGDPKPVVFFLEMFENIQKILRSKDQDPLTELLNRRAFDDTIPCILDALSGRFSQNLHAGFLADGVTPTGEGAGRIPVLGACLAIFDIDHFKNINDTFGHAIGDEVLILFARLMEKMFRLEDKLFRFGGEEFLSILVEVGRAKAEFALNRFRQALEEFPFPQVGQVTVSIGFVMINREDLPPVLIEKADKALYFAKENGRNQVHAYDTLLSQGKITPIERGTEDIELWD